MDKIGAEIRSIAESDVPLTKNMTDIMVLQLRQSVLFERAAFPGRNLTSSAPSDVQIRAIKSEFTQIGHTIAAEIKQAKRRFKLAMTSARSTSVRTDLDRSLSALSGLETDREEYRQLTKQVFQMNSNGDHIGMAPLIASVYRKGDRIDGALTNILRETSKFNDNATHLAENHEQTGIHILATLSGVAIITGLILAFFLTRSITIPLARMTRIMNNLTSGDWTVKVMDGERKDEIGTMATAVQVFKNTLITNMEMAAAQREQEQILLERGKRVERLARDFDTSVSTTLASVTTSACQMETAAQTLSATAEETSRQAGTVASASEQASSNVQTVASAAEQLAASVTEINRQVTQSAVITYRAVEGVQETNIKINALTSSAAKIGSAIELIAEIAGKTNLLALNTSIEAARAGDAGKGFQIVASEVKDLARQTSCAADQIGIQISTMQVATLDAVKAVREIGRRVVEINEISATISSAIEEQSAAIREISRNVEQAAEGAQEVTANIFGVNDAALVTGEASGEVIKATGILYQDANDLQQNVENFLLHIRAA